MKACSSLGPAALALSATAAVKIAAAEIAAHLWKGVFIWSERLIRRSHTDRDLSQGSVRTELLLNPESVTTEHR